MLAESTMAELSWRLPGQAVAYELLCLVTRELSTIYLIMEVTLI